MTPTRNTKNLLLDNAFTISLWIKGIDGTIELLAGFLLLAVSSAGIQYITSMVVGGELGEDPHDVLANLIAHAGHQLSSARLFTALYLLAHGAVKVVLVVYLLKRNIVIYPWALLFLTCFAIYQIYLTWQKFSVLFITLTVFDFIVVGLVWWEYRQLLQQKMRSGV